MKKDILLNHLNTKERKAEIFIKKDLKGDTIFELSKILDLTFSYYHYDEAEIILNSCSGEFSNLNFLINMLNQFKANEKEIGITALFNICNGASFFLSCGTVGKRKAYKNAKFIYNLKKSQTKITFLNDTNLKKYNEEESMVLSQVTEAGITAVNYYRENLDYYFFRKIIKRFLNQACQLELIDCCTIKRFSINKFKKILKDAYSRLFKESIVITPQIALNLFLIDKIV